MRTKTYDYGFRFDVGEKIGSGHFYRCIALTKELLKKRKKVLFFVSNKKALMDHLDFNIPYVILNEKTERGKIQQLMKYSCFISYFIIDLSHSVSLYSKFLPHEKTIIIDDTGNKKIFSKILINFQLTKQFHKYEFNKNITKIYKGKKFVIIRNSIFGKKQKTRINNQKLKNILISISSAYMDEKIIKQFEYVIKQSNYDFTILLRPSLKISKHIQSLTKNKNVKIITKTSNPRNLFLKNDLVISHPGITIYELAYVGIPCIMIDFSQKQKILSNEFLNRGFGLKLGYSKKIGKKLLLMINSLEDVKIRNKMSVKGQKIVDGEGVNRIVKLLLELQ